MVLPGAYVNIGRIIDERRGRGKAIVDSSDATVRSGGVEVHTTPIESMGMQVGYQSVRQAKEWEA